MKVYSLINFKKSIPVPEGFFNRLIINGHKDEDLLRIEFNFCLKKKDTILKKLNYVLREQDLTKTILPAQCNYNLLEQLCDNYKKS